MEAIEFDGNTKTLNFAKKSVPAITEENQVLVKVAYAGVCGTDLHIIQVGALFLVIYGIKNVISRVNFLRNKMASHWGTNFQEQLLK